MKNPEEDSREILYARFGNSCNNNCIFCADGEKLKSQSMNELRKKADRLANIKEGLIMYAEPTLKKDIFELISLCKNRGCKKISLSTNGRMLSYPSFLRALLKKGVNEIIISVHGHKSSLHDSLTRSPGSFDQTKNGLINVCKARKRFRFNFLVATTVTRINLPHLNNICKFVAESFAPDAHILNIVEPRGNALKVYDSLATRYSDCAKTIKKIVNSSPAVKISVTDMPPCIDKQLIQFAGSGQKSFKKDKWGRLNIPNYLSLKKKREECGVCIYDEYCYGIWKEYLKIYGWKEFKPIKNA